MVAKGWFESQIRWGAWGAYQQLTSSTLSIASTHFNIRVLHIMISCSYHLTLHKARHSSGAALVVGWLVGWLVVFTVRFTA
jgi:hypothetical protein